MLGWIAPWAPKVLNLPKGKAKLRPDPLPPPKQLATVWPVREKALDWLRDQQILTPAQEGRLQFTSALQASAGSELVRSSLESRIRSALEDSVAAGEGRDAWAERLGEIVTTSRHEAEAIQRTFNHRAADAGLAAVAGTDAVKDEFPYFLWEGTDDGRERESHRELNGKVAHRDSPLAAKMAEHIKDWNCRCSRILISRADALERGIDDDTGWVEPKAPEPEDDLTLDLGDDASAAPFVAPSILSFSGPQLSPTMKAASTIPSDTTVAFAAPNATPPATDWTDDLTDQERHAVERWSTGDYQRIRSAIKSGNPTEQASNFTKALEAAPTFDGTVYRGLKNIPGPDGQSAHNAWNQIVKAGVGGTWSDAAPMSMTQDPSELSRFTDAGTGVAFRIKSKTGRDIVAAVSSTMKGEREIVSMAGTKYRIVGIAENVTIEAPGFFDWVNGKWAPVPTQTFKRVVDLEEIE